MEELKSIPKKKKWPAYPDSPWISSEELQGNGITFMKWFSLLVAQTVKNLPAMWETWVQSLGWEDHLEESVATHSSIPAWRIHGRRIPKGYSSWGSKEPDMTDQLTLYMPASFPVVHTPL